MKMRKLNSKNRLAQPAQRTDPPTLSELLLNTPLEAGDLPALGEHTDSALTDLGYPPETIGRWRESGVL